MLVANNSTVFTVTGHDPADPAHSIFVTPSISGLVTAGDHYHLQKWEPVGGPPVIATQGGYFTAISGGTNTTFTVFASGAGGAVSNFRPWQVGYYLQPNTKKPSYHKILSVTGNTVTVEGNCAALASTGYANHFRVIAPPDVNGFEGGRVYDPVCEESRYLWAGYRYEWPIVGHRIINTQQPDYNQPGPDGSQTTWDGNALGQYHCWNREYDVLMGRWTTPDPAASPDFNLSDYALCSPLILSDSSGLLLNVKGTFAFRMGIVSELRRICPGADLNVDNMADEDDTERVSHVSSPGPFCRDVHASCLGVDITIPMWPFLAGRHVKGCALMHCVMCSKYTITIEAYSDANSHIIDP